ncbi:MULTISPECIES: tRNA (N6-isopentenyl adenosine(37)-C2)-methylthiotransferase MiaB [Fusobacterium]|uniref:tRNA-2-methylthio-N(6)-dimethylallyladenosine synthase n=2 Tax=Fusobacterium ulcerans TaxID=861 RepID=A0AAX1TTB1_9FUSO|nr:MULTISPECIES: tRNA (N6-isopentenyl adenosine(37)-C2)-methylthiotransferase MiaB [Fusobacterium]AVQ27220.1 tRNA (N6-isopentenyl adenosine(37)-C2)-methylthiotransferase MiaB [Fusobacterium ulcerans]EFS24648.1 (Dimethylallyl)adenosine tRNA methylthiotransferase miaB [Fusobacterium ulcerans ATCC 49185]EHO83052.1 (Dimethylallyl)adenosine tRNA methylthiotransferase miaB [Fusobacterium ulcerans 12-1B]MDH6458106.1 tRNA-2-methylthio-N6-dimethylallyladenosine synthase [Fusobacterium sp. PH5-7]RGY6575
MKKASIITYGCQMNVNESAKIKKIFQNIGYEITENIEESDAIFLNTCTVREGAATQIYGKLGELKHIKERRGSIIGITGCFAQEQGKELLKKFPQIDIIMGNQNIGRIPQAIDDIEHKTNKHVIYTDCEDELPPRLDADFDSKKTASISITYGCNNFCTYCIVPYVRGRERSVPLDEIIHDVKQYAEKGYKEIILLGQNVNSYGKDFKNGDNFAKLLEEICKVEGDFLVRFISPHPRDFSDEVIDVIAKNDKIAKSLHLPLQSGSTRILKMMNRGYTKEQYIALAEKIKERIPGVALTADIIVGFPGETEEDFLDTLDVVKRIQFENSFMFMYSIRQGTKAAEMDEQIDSEVKKERLQRLIEVQNSCSLAESETYMGKTVRILVEGESRKNKDVLTGRTSTNKIVLFKGDKALEGTFVNVKIYDCKTWTLYGDIVD